MAQIDPKDPHKFKRRGILFIVSSPSGAGKSTISRKLLEADAGLEMSVSATTRPPRPGEVDGKFIMWVWDWSDQRSEFCNLVKNAVNPNL